MDGMTLLRRAHEAGLAVATTGDKLVARGPKRAERTALLLFANKPAIMAALAADWRARHRESLAHWRALRTLDEAAGIAWGELEHRWHRLQGARTPEWQ